MKRPLRWLGRGPGTVVPTAFFGNYFCLIPHTDLAFVTVSGNAVTFLKEVALAAAEGHWPAPGTDVHAAIGYSAQSPFLVPTTRMPTFEARHGRRTKFAVWRDPVERLESIFSTYVLRGRPNDYFSMMGLSEGAPWEEFRRVLDWEWSKSDPLAQDEHIRRQVDCYTRDQVDEVVALHALDDFLDGRGLPPRPPRWAVDAVRFELSDRTEREIIRRHYAADLAIPVSTP